MFGYIKVRRPDLRVREYEYYRAAYCGLCRSMGRCTGQCSRLSLSYDVAFLVLMRLALTGEAATFRRRRCVAHPWRRRTMMEPNEALMFSARAAALLTFEKCRDDVEDERGFARLCARVRCAFFGGAYRRAKKRLPALAARIREHLARLSELERARVASADEPAAVFGDLLADVMTCGLSGDAARVAAQIGRQTGRFIYLADAIDDLVKDAKTGNFNPVAALYGHTPDESERAALQDALTLCLEDLAAAFALLPASGDLTAVLENILYLGMPDAARRVLYGSGKERPREQRSL